MEHTNIKTNNAYSGHNILDLEIACTKKGYTQKKWGTFLQAREAGYKIKKGEKGTKIISAPKEYVKENKRTGKNETKTYCACFTVFNIEQMEKIA